MCSRAIQLLLQGELDELEREEFFRLKKVQGNKKKGAPQEEVRGCSRGEEWARHWCVAAAQWRPQIACLWAAEAKCCLIVPHCHRPLLR